MYRNNYSSHPVSGISSRISCNHLGATSYCHFLYRGLYRRKEDYEVTFKPKNMHWIIVKDCASVLKQNRYEYVMPRSKFYTCNSDRINFLISFYNTYYMDSTFQNSFLEIQSLKAGHCFTHSAQKICKYSKQTWFFSLPSKKKVFKIRFLILGTFNIQTKCMLGIQVLNISLVFKTY